MRRRDLGRLAVGSATAAAVAPASAESRSGTRPQRFVAVTKLRSNRSGEHWVTPFGLPGPEAGAIPGDRKRNVWARYRGEFYPVQTEHDLSYGKDGSARHMAAHLRLPASYMAMSDVEIGYGVDGAPPTEPDWPSVTRQFADDFEVEISEYRPKIVAIQGHTDPIQGDSLTIRLKDSRGEQSYKRVFDDPRHWIQLSDVTEEFAPLPQWIRGKTSGATAVLKAEGSWRFVEDYLGQFQHGEIVEGELKGSAKVNLSGVNPRTGQQQGLSHPTRLVNRQLARASNTIGAGTVFDIFRVVSHDPGGRYRCYKNPPIRYSAPPKQGTHDYNEADRHLALSNCINNQTRAGFLGFSPCATSTSEFRPDVPSGGDSSGRWQVWTYHPLGYQWFLPIWPRWHGGEMEDYECTVTVERADRNGRKSEFTVQNGPSYERDLITTSGPAAVVQQARKRGTYLARWRDGVPTARSPIFSGHQVRQEERILQVRDSGGATHPHLVIRALVTFDRGGAVIDRQLRFENSRMYAGAVDLFYDVVAIRVGGTNQIGAEQAPLHRDLVHITGARWSWKQPKPVAMCDPTHFMRARLVAAWERHPERGTSNVEAWQIRTRGMHANRDDQSFPPANSQHTRAMSLEAVGGFANRGANEPLWPAPIVFDGSGGGRGELGAYSYWDWLFWSGDTFRQWEHLEALADNAWGAWPWYWRDERGEGDWADAPPHPYRKWYVLSDRITGSPTPGILPPQAEQMANRMILGKRLIPGNPSWGTGHVSTGEQAYSLWTGTSFGGYGARYLPTPSHCPAHPARNCYLIRPEVWFLDDVEQYGRWHIMSSFTASVPRIGGQVEDRDHVAAISANNGNRGFSWPWRSANHMASLFWDGHPRQATYKRICQDMANHFTINVQRSFLGIYTCRGDRNSNNWRDIPSVKAGMPALVENRTTTPVNANRVAIDTFKSSYVHMAAAQAQDWEVADVVDGITASRWLFSLMDGAPDDKWHWLFGVEALIVSPHPATDNLVTPTGLIYPREDVRLMIADWERKRPDVFNQSRSAHVQGKTIITSPRPDFEAYGWTYVQNYVTEAYHRTALIGFAKHCANEADRKRALFWLDRIFKTFPPSFVLQPSNDRAAVVTYERFWAAQSEILPEMLNKSEW
jgi:hypothetical protein